jgi:hypothetical protein
LKKILSYVTVPALIPGLVMAGFTIPAVSAAEDYGTCGEGVSWTYSNGRLEISGSGMMYDYTRDYQPWIAYYNEITEISILWGVENIGAYAFSDITYLESCSIPDTVTAIADTAFYNSEYYLVLDVTEGSYGEMFADYAGIPTTISGGSAPAVPHRVQDGSYEVLTDNTEEIVQPVYGGPDDAELNTAEEVMTDPKGNIIVVPYAGIAEADELPVDGGLPDEEEDGEYEETETESLEEPETMEVIEEKAEEREEKIIGLDGDEIQGRISWNIDGSVLTLNGSGAMEDFSSASQTPWYYVRNRIKEVIVSDNITSVGDYAFAKCKNLEEVSLPNSLAHIGSHAFYDCTSLEKLTVPSSVLKIEDISIGYKYDKNTKAETSVASFIVYGEAGSQAEVYAKDNALHFVQRIQKQDIKKNTSEESRTVDLRKALRRTLLVAAAAALILAIIYNTWQRNGGIDKLRLAVSEKKQKSPKNKKTGKSNKSEK